MSPPSPPPPPQFSEPPLGIPLLLPPPPPQQPPPPSTRRLPPPCWTPDETSVLIDAYREKWYSLRRGNLRANHWEEVAAEIHRLCPDVSPPKTAVQCRHKMEKLRKRYRAELQRAKSIPHHRFNSSWIYFSKMDSMEKGIDPNYNAVALISHDNVHLVNNNGGFGDFDNNNDVDVDDEDCNNRASFRKDYQRNGLKIRIAGNSVKNYGGFDQIPNPNPNPRYGRYNEFATTPPHFGEGVRFPTRVMKNGDGGDDDGDGNGDGGSCSRMTNKRSVLGKRVRDTESVKGGDGSVAMELAEAIRVMGEGFMRVEKMKMDMVREAERERMEYELKRTQMVLESQRQLVEAFVKGWSDVVNNEDDKDRDDDDDDKNDNKDES